MNRVYNFSAGPSMMPVPVLERAAAELVSYGDSGMSVMEMSHRSKDYEPIIASAEERLRRLMGIPDDYRVLFLQGGASTQFAAVPLNLAGRTGKADYIVSGQFSKKAYQEALKLGVDARAAASSEADRFTRVPDVPSGAFRPDAAYVHICVNNTIYGTRFPALPDTGDIPLVADMSSCILSEPTDVARFGAIYAGAQKNMGPAGVTAVIVRDDLLRYAAQAMPTMLEWRIMAEKRSMYNTPPCYAIYMLGLVCEWLLETGGLGAMRDRNLRKASLLYGYLDGQRYYEPVAHPSCRSVMNVTFRTGDADLDALFASEAAACGLRNLKGHRSVGGLRASIYNAMPYEGVEALVAFMERFASEHPKPAETGRA